MWRCSAVAFVIALALSARGSALAPPPAILVELFTSEGCSSCPAADTLLQALVDTQPVAGVEIIGLGQHVDYWDRRGWKDRFSSATLTRRQQQYGDAFNIESIYTPQMVVDGREQFVGSDAKAARRAIDNAVASPHAAVVIALEAAGPDRFAVSIAVSDLPKISRGDHADIVVAVTESDLRSDVRGGENKGRQLTHAPVVRQMTTIGQATATPPGVRSDLTIAPGWQRDHLKVVAFVQERFSRRVLGAAAALLPRTRSVFEKRQHAPGALFTTM